jgi:hypothetical protein
VSRRGESRRAAQAKVRPPDWFRSAVDAFTYWYPESTWHYHAGSDSPDAIPSAHLEHVPSGAPDTIISLDRTICRDCGAVAGASLDEALPGSVLGRRWWWEGAGEATIVRIDGVTDDFILESHCPTPGHGLRAPVTVGDVRKQTQKLFVAGHATKPVKIRV